MEYIIVENGLITAHKCGASKPDGAVAVPDGFAGYVGLKLDALKDDLSGLKPLSQQISEGVVELPEGHKINETDNEFIRMEQTEIDEKYPIKTYAEEGSFEAIEVRKTFDRDGNFGYWPPEGTVEISGKQPDVTYKAVNGKWAPDPARAKAKRLAEIDERCEEAMKTVVSSYPDSEKQTFPQQSAEAQAYLADPTASVPLLSSLALSRGVTLDELARRVLNKHTVYSVLTGKILGQRKTLQNRVKACSSVEEIEQIETAIQIPQQELNQYLS